MAKQSDREKQAKAGVTAKQASAKSEVKEIKDAPRKAQGEEQRFRQSRIRDERYNPISDEA